MNDPIYEDLAGALDRLANRFPRTSSRIEIKILKKLFSPDEAALASQMGRENETAEAVAQQGRD